MREISYNDYFDCLMFHEKTLDVVKGRVEFDGVYIDLENKIKGKTVTFQVFNHDGYWLLGGVTEHEKIVISAGRH